MHRIGKLCKPLRLIVEAEFAAGNRVADIREDWPRPGSLVVVLRDAFHFTPAARDSGIVYCEVPSRSFWAAQYVHAPSRQIVAYIKPEVRVSYLHRRAQSLADQFAASSVELGRTIAESRRSRQLRQEAHGRSRRKVAQ
jgi:hypothetical protein